MFTHSGAVAQLGERCVRNAEVVGSIPVGSILSSVASDALSLALATLTGIARPLLIRPAVPVVVLDML